MKLLLFLCAAFLFRSATAQELKTELKKFIEQEQFNKQGVLPKNIPYPPVTILLQKDTTPVSYLERLALKKNGRPLTKDSITILLKQYLAGKPKGRSVQILPRDNMPCIVPDTKDIANIPNAWPGKTGIYKGIIPNPAQPGPQKVQVLPNK